MMINKYTLADLKHSFSNSILLNERNILDYLYGVDICNEVANYGSFVGYIIYIFCNDYSFLLDSEIVKSIYEICQFNKTENIDRANLIIAWEMLRTNINDTR